jgi:hypothetical protein
MGGDNVGEKIEVNPGQRDSKRQCSTCSRRACDIATIFAHPRSLVPADWRHGWRRGVVRSSVTRSCSSRPRDTPFDTRNPIIAGMIA